MPKLSDALWLQLQYVNLTRKATAKLFRESTADVQLLIFRSQWVLTYNPRHDFSVTTHIIVYITLFFTWNYTTSMSRPCRLYVYHMARHPEGPLAFSFIICCIYRWSDTLCWFCGVIFRMTVLYAKKWILRRLGYWISRLTIWEVKIYS